MATASLRRWIALLQVWLVLLLHPGARAGLRLLHVSVPPVLLRGETASLQCEYELGGDRLYSVQWYKDDDEIYRYVPRAAMQKHSYQVDGVYVDRHSSDERRVVLRNVNLKSSGTYRCEVSAEAPSFQSVHGEGRLEVVALPQKGPEITGLERPEYQMGDTLSVNCTSDRSYPAAKLRWYINDRPVDPSHEAQLSAHGLFGAARCRRGSAPLSCCCCCSWRPPGPRHDAHGRAAVENFVKQSVTAVVIKTSQT
ncbi:Cell adhesion molecule 2 [Frankliniella fusca]|uniref:Cell adhesion molecule 2 n=1 Tax=Frankliniella fusca TaxID=407009 RepID=A0AAE1LCP5_9NEOP|nr:Cell adhesion molecule 2 [Frankliniella fusca]